MPKTVKSLDELLRVVSKDIKSAIEKETSQTKIKKVMAGKVMSEVYSAYTPTFYKRRGARKGSGGLADTESMSVRVGMKKDGVFVNISNDSRPIGFDEAGRTNMYLDEIIEEGTGGEAPWEQPRPFMAETENELRDKEIIENIIKKEVGYIK